MACGGGKVPHDQFVFGFCARRAQKPKTRKAPLYRRQTCRLHKSYF